MSETTITMPETTSTPTVVSKSNAKHVNSETTIEYLAKASQEELNQIMVDVFNARLRNHRVTPEQTFLPIMERKDKVIYATPLEKATALMNDRDFDKYLHEQLGIKARWYHDRTFTSTKGMLWAYIVAGTKAFCARQLLDNTGQCERDSSNMTAVLRSLEQEKFILPVATDDVPASRIEKLKAWRMQAWFTISPEVYTKMTEIINAYEQ